jgi:ElaB/YqjD/DUF883 family membrane-anchored ribosome-binding protein
MADDSSKSATSEKKEEKREEEKKPSRLYVYCIVASNAPKNYGSIGIGGYDAPVQTIEFKDIAAVVSEVPDESFEKTDESILSHQRVVQKVFEKHPGVPLTFSTVKENNDQVKRLLEDNYGKYKDQLTKLGAFETPGPSTDTEETGSTDLVSQVLEQSASSAIKIRQMSDELEDIRRKTYEKAMERATDGAMKRLFDVLAHAPPGSVEVREPSGEPVQTGQLERLQKQLYELAEQLALLVKVQWDKSEKEQQKLNDEIVRLVKHNQDSIASVEKMLRGTFREYFDTVPPAIEDLVKKTVREHTERTQQVYVKCAGCGSEFPQVYSFCPNCGRVKGKLEREQQGRVTSSASERLNDVKK